MHVKGDTRGGINRPGIQTNIQQMHPDRPMIKQQNAAARNNALRQLVSENTPFLNSDFLLFAFIQSALC